MPKLANKCRNCKHGLANTRYSLLAWCEVAKRDMHCNSNCRHYDEERKGGKK